MTIDKMKCLIFDWASTMKLNVGEKNSNDQGITILLCCICTTHYLLDLTTAAEKALNNYTRRLEKKESFLERIKKKKIKRFASSKENPASRLLGCAAD